jgi:hypothetical protein
LVTPSWAVTAIEIALSPTFKGMLPEAVPDATGVPLTVIVAIDPAVAVGVTVTDVVA